MLTKPQAWVTPSCNPSTQGVEARGLEVQSHPWLYSWLEASLLYMRSCLKKKKVNEQIKKYKIF